MDAKQERARRVVAYLERRTVGNGCTPPEAAEASAKADEIRKKYGLGTDPVNVDADDPLVIELEFHGPTLDELFAAIMMEAEARAFGTKKRPRRRVHVRVFTFRFLWVLGLPALASCDDEPEQYASGFVCTCEQRAAVAEYVERSQTAGISDDSDYYLDHLFAVAVKTHCDHRDSVRVDRARSAIVRIGGEPCELWFPDFGPIRP